MGVGQLIRNVITAETDPTVASFTKSLTSSNTILTAVNAASGTISASILPSYVDDVLSYTALVNFPGTGEIGKIYVDETTNKVYRWSGSVYVEISSSATAGEALKLTTPRTISTTGDATYSISFDGSANVSGTITLANTGVAAGTYNALSTQVRPFTVDSKGRITGVSEAINITPPWSAVTGTPTTLSGYGITNALPLSGGTVTGDLVSTSATPSTSTTTGASVIAGGQGVGGNQHIGGFTSLGGTADGHPAIKVKVLYGTTGETQGSISVLTHEITGIGSTCEIIACSVLVNYGGDSFVSPGHPSGYYFYFSLGGTYLIVVNHATDSGLILSKLYRATITYRSL